MTPPSAQTSPSPLRVYAPRVLGVVALVALAALSVRWIARQRSAPPPRKVTELRVVNVRPEPPAPKPVPPPPQVAPPKVVEHEPQSTRVEIKASDVPPPDAPRPAEAPPAGGGRLSLAAEGSGPGDAFGLAGNPGGRGLLSGGGLGDGSGDGGDIGQGYDASSRYGWYYSRVAGELEDALRKKNLTSGSVRVEFRVWTEPSGRITRLKLTASTGDPRLDEALQSLVGTRLAQAPPADVPMPMILRLTIRRPT